jgi:hypothetical protein
VHFADCGVTGIARSRCQLGDQSPWQKQGVAGSVWLVIPRHQLSGAGMISSPATLQSPLHHTQQFTSTPSCRHKHRICRLLHKNALQHCPIIGPSSAGLRQSGAIWSSNEASLVRHGRIRRKPSIVRDIVDHQEYQPWYIWLLSALCKVTGPPELLSLSSLLVSRLYKKSNSPTPSINCTHLHTLLLHTIQAP